MTPETRGVECTPVKAVAYFHNLYTPDSQASAAEYTWRSGHLAVSPETHQSPALLPCDATADHSNHIHNRPSTSIELWFYVPLDTK